jgi:ATP-binding cassette subfamily C (CFTR/MRP) protein 1
MSFFDTTPVGRLVNRFSKDMYTIDEQLMGTLRTYLQTLFGVFSTLLVISSVTPLFLLCLVPMLIFYLKEQSFFTISYRELKRLDSVSRSPIYALLGESVDGVAVIRAFAAQKSLLCRLTDMLDIQQHAYFLTCAAQSWLAVRLELIGTLIVTFAALSAVLEHTRSGADGTFAGLAGLSISYALSVTQSLNWSVRMASDMEANMVAVERVEEYSNIQSEGLRSTPVDAKLPQVWPPKGAIEFTEVRLRYRPGLPFVLKGLNLTIPPGSKIGVVGRTGAGKSTLMIALMRIVDVTEGTIKIDGTDISEIGLARLRRTLAVIPQDPVLFSGSVRSNLDPFHEYEDDALLDILDRVGLYARSRTSSTQSLPSLGQICIRTLTDVIAEGGINFSVGQRQLLVIARALLRGAKIVIMDEATAAVDAGTDAAIQKVIRTEFTEATCITVAHRINTILDSDYILVMSDGKAEEFDKPDMLLKKGGLFRDLVRASADNT